MQTFKGFYKCTKQPADLVGRFGIGNEVYASFLLALYQVLILLNIFDKLIKHMAHTKSGGSTQNSRDSSPKYLGIKIQDGGTAKPGFILVRQRGTKFVAGIGTQMGKDNTIFALKEGKVKFEEKRKKRFDGSQKRINRISVQ